ncbi:exodeoxyribonuclease V subunit alpha [Castellaniella caeni]|uniref:exodeoxyribonuclease V subunit alpha n=1 Tax=Castellaniella caeni TaxID=266123 RepID=UPI00082D70E4|nr:exodeoxyribonuclease V subunit alpha [Castellaniella caeni]
MIELELPFGPTQDAPPVARAIDRALEAFLQREFPVATPAQCRLAGLVSRQLAQGHLCLALDATDSAALVQAYCGAPLADLLADNPLLAADGTRPLVLEGRRLYLLRYWRLETRLAGHIRARLAREYLRADGLLPWLDVLFERSTEQPDWQRVACALAGRSGFGIVTGGPGTGKTTTVVKLLALLQQQACAAGRPLLIELAAPTGKAANRLETSIGRAIDDLPLADALKAALPRRVKTLHRLLGTRRDSRHFRHDARHRLVADLIVVDEASMVDIDLMVALLDALPDACRLILVGDKDQLASVEAGAVMAELCRAADQAAYDAPTCDFIRAATGLALPPAAQPGSALAQQTVKLRKNWRSKDAPGIAALAQAINRQDVPAVRQAFQAHPAQLRRVAQAPGWITRELIDGEAGIARLLDEMRATRPAAQADAGGIDAWAHALLRRQGRQQLLTPLRQGPDGIEGLNERVIRQLRRQGLVGQENRFAGLPVLVTRNLYDLGLMNGDLGMLLDHPRKGLRVAFADMDGIRWIVPDQLETQSQAAYALSVHQSQGSEFARVLLHMPDRGLSDQAGGLLSKELVYTAVTRASQQFVLLDGRPGLFEQAVQVRTQRQSGLGDRLHGDL